MKISPIEVTYRSHMGSDLDVVNAARVSFAKESDWDSEEYGSFLKEKDEKLIRYLAEHNHWSPFSHCFISFHVKAPIFIARQLQKHTVGLAWNEVSRRYVDDEPEFYTPIFWRKRADNVKQGSSNKEVKESVLCNSYLLDTYEDCLDTYQALIDAGVAAEQARMSLPQGTHTEWIWSGSLYAFARVCNLRLGEGAQREAGEVAQQIKEILQLLFPVSCKYLLEK